MKFPFTVTQTLPKGRCLKSPGATVFSLLHFHLEIFACTLRFLYIEAAGFSQCCRAPNYDVLSQFIMQDTSRVASFGIALLPCISAYR